MSVRSHLSLSLKIRSVIELAADVVNSDSLEVASKYYQKAIHAAASEIMNINIQMGNIIGQDSSSSIAARNGCHEDLRLIGIIIGLLRTKMAILHGGIGEYDRAIDLCKGAVQVHRHQPVLKSISSNLSDVDDVAGLMVLIIERLEKSQLCFEDHKDLLNMIDRHAEHDVQSGADVSSKRIVHDMLEKSASKSLNIQDEILEVLSVHTAKQDKHDEGIMYLRDALQIHLVALGLKQPHSSTSLMHVARMYRGFGNDRNNESLVLGYFQHTAEVLQRSNLSQQSRASILNDIAVIHMRRKMYDEAIKFLLDALHAYDESVEDISIKHGHHIATLQIWRNLGECYMQLFKFKSAEGALLKALHIQRDCVKIHETVEKLEIEPMKINESLLNLSNDVCIADTICQIGKARAGGGSYKQALDIYREALRVLNRNAAADLDRSDTELLKKKDQLTHLLYCIAEAERAIDELEKSLQMYLLSLRLRKSNGADEMDKRKSTRIHCLSCFLGMIDIFVRQKNFDEAKNQIKEAMSYSVKYRVKKTHPIVLAIRKKAKDCEQAISEAAMRNPDVDALEKKADAEIERGALDMATETLRHLLVIRRATLKEMKARGEDTKDQVYAIACLLQTFGFVFAKNGDDENAERAFKDASRLFRKGGNPNENPRSNPNLVHI
jgi:tetratricopeptide (TPR) repeat protein